MCKSVNVNLIVQSRVEVLDIMDIQVSKHGGGRKKLESGMNFGKRLESHESTVRSIQSISSLKSNRQDPQISMMHTIFAPKAPFEPSSEPESQPEPDPLLSQSNTPPSETPIPTLQFAEQVTFWLDLPSSSESNVTEDETQQQALLSHVQPLK